VKTISLIIEVLGAKLKVISSSYILVMNIDLKYFFLGLGLTHDVIRVSLIGIGMIDTCARQNHAELAEINYRK